MLFRSGVSSKRLSQRVQTLVVVRRQANTAVFSCGHGNAVLFREPNSSSPGSDSDTCPFTNRTDSDPSLDLNETLMWHSQRLLSWDMHATDSAEEEGEDAVFNGNMDWNETYVLWDEQHPNPLFRGPYTVLSTTEGSESSSRNDESGSEASDDEGESKAWRSEERRVGKECRL